MVFGWLKLSFNLTYNCLFGFNIKDNGIKCYNFDIVRGLELSILLFIKKKKKKLSILLLPQLTLLLKFET